MNGLEVKDSHVAEDGTWTMVLKVTDDETWERIKDGQVVGLSVGGQGRIIPVARWYIRAWRWIKYQLGRLFR